jgi:hypothetical protein
MCYDVILMVSASVHTKGIARVWRPKLYDQDQTLFLKLESQKSTDEFQNPNKF